MPLSACTRNKLNAWSDIPLRIALAATFIAHGLDKFTKGMDGFAASLGHLGVPAPEFFAWVAALAELGGILVLLGLFTRLAAFGILCDMAVAILTVNGAQGFSMHTGASPMPMGYEWQFALAMMALTLVIRGAGPLSFDQLIHNTRTAEEPVVDDAAVEPVVETVPTRRVGRAVAFTTAADDVQSAKSIGVAPGEPKPDPRTPIA